MQGGADRGATRVDELVSEVENQQREQFLRGEQFFGLTIALRNRERDPSSEIERDHELQQ